MPSPPLPAAPLSRRNIRSLQCGAWPASPNGQLKPKAQDSLQLVPNYVKIMSMKYNQV